MMIKKHLLFVVLATALAVLLVPGVAFAFDSVHGGYALDTDACAGCHRAHSAASALTWTDGGGDTRSALLNSDAADPEAFCETCHGSAGLGADTNVFDGVFESRDGDLGSDELYNADGEALNGGGFDSTVFTGFHYGTDVDWWAWGAGPNGQPDGPILPRGGVTVSISCIQCHDTHGSSNYRLLKDIVAGVDPITGALASIPVGGYDGGGNPTPFVISAERGYPATGWPQGAARMALYTTYYPDFTDARYAKPPVDTATGLPDPSKGISAWCAACHTQMNTKGDSGNVTDANGTAVDNWRVAGGNDYLAEIYDFNDGWGLVERHRHPVNVPITTFDGPSAITLGNVPLAHDPAEGAGGAMPVDTTGDWVDCLTCHVAHGSSAVMTGYANVASSVTPQPDTGSGSVDPEDGNALLRMDNRGVCQACHNKG